MIHRMVYTYYSTYKSVMKYFVSDDWEKLLEKKVKSKKDNVERDLESVDRSPFAISPIGQTLIVYPDLRTIMNTVDEPRSVGVAKKDAAFLSSTNSQ
jgi:hypothetical protein